MEPSAQPAYMAHALQYAASPSTNSCCLKPQQTRLLKVPAIKQLQLRQPTYADQTC